MLLIQLPLSYSIHMVRHTAFGAQQSHLIPLASMHGGEGSSFPGSALPKYMLNSEYVMSIKPGDSCVVIGYQADEFIHTWLAECFIIFILVMQLKGPDYPLPTQTRL